MPSSALQHFTTVYDYDNSGTAYNDHTLEAQSSQGTAFAVLGATADFLYLGSAERFDMAIFDVDTAGSVGDITWEYYRTSTTAWTEFVPSSGELRIDPEDSSFGLPYKFDEDNGEIFSPARLVGWGEVAVNSITQYWVRASVASVATAPTIKRIQMRAVNAYCSTKDVFEFLELATVTGGTDFTTSTTPTKRQVEDRITAAQAKIEYLSRKYFRPTLVLNETHPFNLHGFKLDKANPYKLLNVEVWDGSSWTAKTQGRSEDYFLVPEVGMVYFARFFVLPARFLNYNSAMWAYGGGEFKESVRTSYIAGRNIHIDAEGPAAFDAALKWACSDLIANFDFGGLIIAGGSANLSGSEKVTMWKQEAEDWAESLRSWEVF